MSDYKNYIVNYDIKANTEGAIAGLEKLGTIANELTAPMDKLKQTMTTVNQTLTALKNNAAFTFEPKIDVRTFNQQIKSMVLSVKAAATEMHSAIYGALKGNGAGINAIKQGVDKSLGTKSIKDLKSSIEAYEKELDKLMGTPKKGKGEKTIRAKDGSILMAQNAGLTDRVVDLKARKEAIQQQLKATRAELAAMEQMEKEVAATQTKGAKTTRKLVPLSSKQTATSSVQPAKLTNVTPAVIREWGKVFGDAKSKSLTISIKANAGGENGAITVINQVKTALDGLKTLGTFEIAPTLNKAALTTAETELTKLANLSKAIVAPFGGGSTDKKQGATNALAGLTKEEQDKLKKSQAAVKSYRDKITTVQGRLLANQEKYGDNPPPIAKAQIARDNKLLGQYRKGLAVASYDADQLQTKAAAVQGTTKNVKPLAVNLVGELTGVNTAGKEFVVPVIGQITKITPPQNVEIPASIKITAAQINNAIKAIPRPALPMNVKLQWEKGAIGKNQQLKGITDGVPPVKLTLDTTLAVEKLNEFITLLKSKSPQNIALTATGTATNAAQSATTTASTTTVATSTSGGGNKSKTPPTARERYEAMQKKALASTLSTKQTVEKWKGYNAQAENYHAERQRMYNSLFGTGSTRAVRQKMYNELFGAVPQQPGWQQAANRVKRLDDAVSTFQKGLTPYEQAEHKRIAKEYADLFDADEKKRTAKNTADHKRRASALRAQVHNAMLPFASNQSQLNTLMQHRKFFSRAIDATGIVPMQGMQAPQMLRYLQNVSQQMQSANVQVPMQLQAQINKLQAQIAKATQAAAQASQAASTASKSAIGSKSKAQTVMVAEKPKSFYDRTRKWAYPFTGNTSFGARTPMAVEMAKGMGVMFAVGGAMSAVGGSFSEAVEYQNLMRTTNAILKNGTDTYTPSGFSNMERTVRDVGIKTKFSAPEVASAAKFLAMAGYDIEAINNAIQPIADLALIGDADLGETADKMTNIMTTFGYDSKYLHKNPEIMRQLGNIMATTATRSNTDLMMLAESAKYGGGVAKLYGGKDPNLFADTMALFGVMGNAGIQASSAGTALRMMYQNIFKPNRNQQAMLDQLKASYGISTLNSDGSYRSMTDILVQIANRVPENKMADVVGKLFRITAQPGAAATLNAAAQEDGTDAAQVAGGIDAVAKFATEKGGLSALVSLMQANRASVSGNILGSVAEEKQNTIKGLWAQVTSTFTEGILQAFEKNEGYFVQKLSELRDYLAKPETIEMIQKLIDMVISIGEIMAKFVKIWVDFYQKFEPIVKAWIVTQMFFTQVGSLITPLIAVISVFDRLRSSLMAFAGISSATTGASAIGAASVLGGIATGASRRIGVATPAPLGGMPIGIGIGRRNRTYHSMADKYDKYITSAMIARGFVVLDWKNQADRKLFASTDNRLQVAYNNAQRYREAAKVIRRQQMSNPELLSRLSKVQMHRNGGFWKGIGTGVKAGLTAMSLSNLFGAFGSLKGVFVGLMSGLAKAVGMLVSPFTLVAAAAGTLGYAIFKLGQYASSATDAQIEAYRDLKKELKNSANDAKNRHSGTDKFLEENGLGASRVEGYKEDPEYGKPKVSEFAKNYPYLFNNEIVSRSGASRKANKSIVESMKAMYSKDATMKLALGDEYEKYINDGLVLHSEQIEEKAFDPKTNRYIDAKGRAGNAISALLSNWLFGEKDTASDLIDNATILAIKAEGAKNSKILQAREQIFNLYKKIGYTDEFLTKAKSIAKGAANVDDPNLVGDEYITKEKLGDPQFDISRLKSYVQAGYNVLIGEIEGREGSLIGFLKAQEKVKSDLAPYSEAWWNSISQIVNNYRLMQDIEFGGKTFKDIELLVKMLPSGELDHTNILKQVQERVTGFNGNIQWYLQLIDKVYELLAGIGKVPNTPEARRDFLDRASQGIKMSDDDIENNYVKTDGELYKNEYVSDWDKYSRARNNAISKYLESKDKVLKTSPTPNTDGKNGKGGTGNPDPTKQNDYDSKYDRSAAKPTQIIFNIDKLANFDRTTVAASAEERDLMNAMESKIAEMVYRIVAEAMNTSNNMRS